MSADTLIHNPIDRNPEPPGEKNSGLKPVMWVALGLAVVLAGVTAFRASSRTGDADQVSTGNATAVASAETSVESGAVADEAVSAEYVVGEFIQGWAAGDWTRVAEVASESVAATARADYVDGRMITAVGTPENDRVEVLVIDGEGPALIYSLTLGTVDGRTLVVDLVWTGDAG